MVQRCLARFDPEEVVCSMLLGLIVGSVMVIGLDLKALLDERAAFGFHPASSFVEVRPVRTQARQPVVHAPEAAPRRRGDVFRHPLRFSLGPDGVLKADGAIEVGASRRFAEELARHGGRITALSIDSPGGSLEDAMAMARMARERGLATSVPAGATCASSCPLVLAGGVTRSVGEGATVGVHQFHADGSQLGRPAVAISDAQVTMARIARHLDRMGVDPALWLHALETPSRSLYRLSRGEMAAYRLVTG
jgi:hypothetical protein